jgi:hypothetical protein
MGPVIGLVLTSIGVGAVLWLFYRQDAQGRRWLDSASNVDRLCYAVYGVCALLLVADPFYERHPHFGFETWLGDWISFSGLYGLGSCVGLVLAAKVVRLLLRRDEDYYD